MSIADDDLAARRQVWVALSDLYLDTEVESLHEACAQVLADSPYTLHDLERMLREDVDPLLRRNLMVPAGVWDGFDADWLVARILENQRKLRLGRWFNPLFNGYADEIWRELQPRIVAARNGVASSFSSDRHEPS